MSDSSGGAALKRGDTDRPLSGEAQAGTISQSSRSAIASQMRRHGTGALLVRDGAALGAVHGMQTGYLPPAADEEFYDPAQHGPELLRGFPVV